MPRRNSRCALGLRQDEQVKQFISVVTSVRIGRKELIYITLHRQRICRGKETSLAPTEIFPNVPAILLGALGRGNLPISPTEINKMNKEILENSIEKFISWHKEYPNTTRLQKHEAMKAILFNQFCFGGKLEEKILTYHTTRSGLIDYVDYDTAIEIDDGPNIKSLRKLNYVRREKVLFVFWILILSTGNGGKASRLSKEFHIPTARIFARRNPDHVFWEWI